MTTRLIIMRHAKSTFLNGQQEDFERPLDNQGQKRRCHDWKTTLELRLETRHDNGESINKNHGNTKSDG